MENMVKNKKQEQTSRRSSTFCFDPQVASTPLSLKQNLITFKNDMPSSHNMQKGKTAKCANLPQNDLQPFSISGIRIFDPEIDNNESNVMETKTHLNGQQIAAQVETIETGAPKFVTTGLSTQHHHENISKDYQTNFEKDVCPSIPVVPPPSELQETSFLSQQINNFIPRGHTIPRTPTRSAATTVQPVTSVLPLLTNTQQTEISAKQSVKQTDCAIQDGIEPMDVLELSPRSEQQQESQSATAQDEEQVEPTSAINKASEQQQAPQITANDVNDLFPWVSMCHEPISLFDTIFLNASDKSQKVVKFENAVQLHPSNIMTYKSLNDNLYSMYADTKAGCTGFVMMKPDGVQEPATLNFRMNYIVLSGHVRFTVRSHKGNDVLVDAIAGSLVRLNAGVIYTIKNNPDLPSTLLFMKRISEKQIQDPTE